MVINRPKRVPSGTTVLLCLAVTKRKVVGMSTDTFFILGCGLVAAMRSRKHPAWAFVGTSFFVAIAVNVLNLVF